MNTNFQCHFCDRSFHFKELFERHEPVCEYFYKNSREKQYDNEIIESLPPIQDMFKLMQKMYLELNQQKVKIEQLEKVIRMRSKGNSLYHTPIPASLFSYWVRHIEVKYDQLIYTFKNGIFDGIRKCLQDEIKEKGLNKIPIRTSLDKPNLVYLYKQNTNGKYEWTLCDAGDIVFLVENLMDKFMEAYCKWEDDHKDWICKSSDNKELHVEYLCKISGSLIYNKEKKRQELKNWLCKETLYDPEKN